MSTTAPQADLIEAEPDDAVPEPAPEPAPSLEERVAALEAALREKTRLVTEYALEADERRESRNRVRELEVKAANAKENANRAKKAYETALEDHLALEDSLATGQARLPFAAGDGRPGSPAAAAAGDEPFPPPGEAWRAVPLCDLGGEPELAHGVVAALAEAGLATVGQLADWTFGGHVLTDVPGVGPAKAEAIEAALEAFWRRRGAAHLTRVETGLRDAAAWDRETASMLAAGPTVDPDEEPEDDDEIEGDDEPEYDEIEDE